MGLINIELDQKRKEFFKVFVFSILGLIVFYNVLSYVLGYFFPYYKMVTPQKLLLAIFFCVVYVSYLISKTKYDFYFLCKFIAISLFLLVSYVSLHICHKSIAINFFFIPILLLFLMTGNIKTMAICSFVVILLCFFMPQISIYFEIAYPTKSSVQYLKILKVLETVIMLFSVYFSLLILYYYNQLLKIEIKNSVNTKKSFIQDEIQPKSKEPQKEGRFENLYDRIVENIEKEKPFQDPHFSKSKLAKNLKTNETYISKALKENGDKNFNALINEYRIKQVVEEFNVENLRSHTIEHIYTKAGFTQQSTFNRVFKEHIRSTPSEYIEKNIK